MDIERIIRADEADNALEVIVLASFFDGIGECELGFGLAFFDVGFLTPEGAA